MGARRRHGEAVTDKAERIIEAALTLPRGARRQARARAQGRHRCSSSAAAWRAPRPPPSWRRWATASTWSSARPFLGGRAARIGTVFPTNDCGQCLPTTDAQAGTCASASTATWPSTTPTCASGAARRSSRSSGGPATSRSSLRPPAQHRHRRLRQLRRLRDRVPGRERRRRRQGDLHRVLRRTRRPHRRPREPAPSAAPAPRRARWTRSTSASRPSWRPCKAGAILTAVGCEPAPDAAHRAPRLRSGRASSPRPSWPNSWTTGRRQAWLGHAAGQGGRDDPVRRLARPAPPALLLAPLLHDRAQARDPAAHALPRR